MFRRLFCKHTSETHWIYGFFPSGYDKKITTCTKCGKILSIEDVHIGSVYPTVKKTDFINEMNRIVEEKKKKDYSLDLMFEEIYKKLSLESTKLKYYLQGRIQIEISATSSLSAYIQRMEYLNEDWEAVVYPELTKFIESLDGWKITNILLCNNYFIRIELS